MVNEYGEEALKYTSPEAHGGVPNGPGAPTHSDRVKAPFSYFCVDARSWRESTKRNGKVR